MEVNLSNLTVNVSESGVDEPYSSKPFIEIEVLTNITLYARETRTIPIAVKCSKAANLVITHARYDFLSILPTTESLACRGRRLHGTPAQRQTPTYAPDVLLKVEVAEADHRLLVNFIDQRRLILYQGENAQLRLWLSNAGERSIGEAWIVSDSDDEFWLKISDSIADDEG